MTKAINPFSETYYKRELRSFRVKDGELGNIKLKHESVYGRIDGYMHADFGELKNFPTFYIGSDLWMSLTPMEAQSHYMPIEMAEGHVGVAGLGMGYYLQRILNKEEVEKITVYEIDQNVIQFYLQNFGEHPKVEFRCEDVRQMTGQTYDLFYCDIYPGLVDPQAIPDMALLTENNDIDTYHFWTIEQVIAEILAARYRVRGMLLNRYYPFLQNFLKAKGEIQRLVGNGDELYHLMVDYKVA